MLAPAFEDPALASQAVFRTVMEAMARPGLARPLPCGLAVPPPLLPTAAAVALTLLDYETPFWLDPALAEAGEVAAWIRFHTGATPDRGSGARSLWVCVRSRRDAGLRSLRGRLHRISGPLDHAGACRSRASVRARS